MPNDSRRYELPNSEVEDLPPAQRWWNVGTKCFLSTAHTATQLLSPLSYFTYKYRVVPTVVFHLAEMGCGGSKSLPIEAGLGGGHHADAHTSMLKSHEQENQPSVPAPVKDAPITSPPKKAPSSNVVRSPTQNQGGDAAVAVALRSKRSGFILEGTSVQVDANYVKKVVPKDPAARELILQAMQHNITLKDFGEKNLQDMVDAMETRVVPAGTTIIEEGQPGDNCYVIESGKVCRNRAVSWVS